MPDTKIKEQWESYRRDVIPQDAGRIQLIECRRAFYAGARSLHSILYTQISDGAEMTAADVEMVESLSRELEQFAADVRTGKA